MQRYFDFILVLFMRLITENKWKQDCGVRRYDLGLRSRSLRLMFRVIRERDARRYLTWQGDELFGIAGT